MATTVWRLEESNSLNAVSYLRKHLSVKMLLVCEMSVGE